jgi:hypothetical protein
MKTSPTVNFLLFCALAASVPAQPAPPPTNNTTAPDTAGNDGRRRRGNSNPVEAQARLMDSLRGQLAVKDDAEWSLIAERITAILELRRSMGTGRFGSSAGSGGNRPSVVVTPEQAALHAALADNLSDAEITARLIRLREMRKQNETRLDQAHEDLRAVLTVRQEAVAVIAGLLN